MPKPQQDIYWGGPPVATSRDYPQPRTSSRAYRQQHPGYPRQSGYGSDEYERRRIIAEEDRRRAMIERERQADERKIKSAMQSQAQSSCVQAGGDRTLCRNAATLGSIFLP
jgi:hypothetical protein